MSRMRQIPVMDITQREKLMQQNQSTGLGNITPPAGHPSMHNTMRPAQMNHRARVRKVPAAKFRLSDTPALIAGGCSSVREFCNNVQNITMDLNNLIGSVESMVPLLNTYLTVLQSRSAIAEQELDPPIEVTARESAPANHACTAGQSPFVQSQPQQNPATMTAPMLRPEDIQNLLENPLVRNLLNGFMQNGAFPNAGQAKENTPNR